MTNIVPPEELERRRWERDERRRIEDWAKERGFTIYVEKDWWGIMFSDYQTGDEIPIDEGEGDAED